MSRYSQLYIERGKPEQDSERFRGRIGATFLHAWTAPGVEAALLPIIAAIELNTGRKVPPSQSMRASVARFIEAASMPDVLDTVTLVLRVLENPNQHSVSAAAWRQQANFWRGHIARALEEENLAYRLGNDGVVHPFVDQEFEANRVAAVETLAAPKFREARTDFEAAFRHLRDGQGKQALRMMFPCVETTAKVLFPGRLPRLMPNELDRHLLPRLEAKYAGNQPALVAGQGLVRAFKEWIIAAQPYRHGQEIQEPAEPPQDFVVAHLSTGAALLRWMIELCE